MRGAAASGCVRLQAREAERTVEPRLVGALRAGYDAQAGGDPEDELQCELCVAAAQPVEGELVLGRIEQQRGVAQQVMPDGVGWQVGWRVGCMDVGWGCMLRDLGLHGRACRGRDARK